MNTDVAERVGRLLRAKKESISVAEGTTGGLINASLQSAERASRFVTCGISIYSIKGGKGLLPVEVRRQLGGTENYRNGEVYMKSKETFARVMAEYMKSQVGTSWAVAESGATTVNSLPQQMRDTLTNGFTVVGVARPDGQVLTFTKVSTHNDRLKNMEEFTTYALEALEQCILSYEASKL
eukprot:TRINITY_DN23715_c0_g1_i1.p1 TRINITY_DN23715_c0_g1~~TRINITY_DN23715_c0_g1_i1.p1  ORF type:complete len:181 (+),score=34.58 TRINITY_DN23715_c0_g1_i1:38-580(+)